MSHTFLFQPTNGIGLGHVSRLASIALAVQRLRPESRILFAVLGGSHSLLQSWGLPSVSVPVDLEYGEQVWSGWSPLERARLGYAMAFGILKAANPSLVIFDCLAGPSFAKAAIAQNRAIAMCLREMNDWTAFEESSIGILDAARALIVAHEPASFQLPESLAVKAQFVGEIVKPSAQGEVPADASYDVVITGGGGGARNTIHFYNAAVEAFRRCRTLHPHLKALLVTGPLFTDWYRLETTDGVKIVPCEPNLSGLFSRCRLVLAQAGYNTLAEVAQTGVPAISVPVETYFDNQMKRAERLALASNGKVRVAQGSNPLEICQLMLELLKQPPSEYATKPVSLGADRAARILVDLAEA
ncbi:MAG: glycosyltransferase [Acidobacteriota bacterium]